MLRPYGIKKDPSFRQGDKVTYSKPILETPHQK